jgi:phage FluMu protein Com
MKTRGLVEYAIRNGVVDREDVEQEFKSWLVDSNGAKHARQYAWFQVLSYIERELGQYLRIYCKECGHVFLNRNPNFDIKEKCPRCKKSNCGVFNARVPFEEI